MHGHASAALCSMCTRSITPADFLSANQWMHTPHGKVLRTNMNRFWHTRAANIQENGAPRPSRRKRSVQHSLIGNHNQQRIRSCVQRCTQSKAVHGAIQEVASALCLLVGLPGSVTTAPTTWAVTSHHRGQQPHASQPPLQCNTTQARHTLTRHQPLIVVNT